MSEKLRTPERLRLSGICIIPAGKAGKAAKKQRANERKARLEDLRQLAKADAKNGVGLLVMFTATDRRLCQYIIKKLDKVIPFYVRTFADGTLGLHAREMSWLYGRCEKRGYRTLWLNLSGTEKYDKKDVLDLVVAALIREYAKPVEAAAKKKKAEKTAEAAAETATVVVAAEPETGAAEEKDETVKAEAVSEAQEIAVTETVAEEKKTEESEAVGAEAVAEIEAPAEPAGGESSDVPEAMFKENEGGSAEISESEPAADAAGTKEDSAEVKAETTKETAAEVKEEAPAKPTRRRTRKTTEKAEGEKAPAKPRRKRAPRGPLTVEETLAKRRKQMGLE